MKRSVLVILCLFISSSAFGQLTDSPSWLTKTLEKLQEIRSGEIKYVIVEKSLAFSREKGDTCTLEFCGTRDSSGIGLIIQNNHITITYEDTSMVWVDWKEKTIFRQTVPQSKILDRLDYWLFWSYLNNGHALRKYMDMPGARVSTSDTLVHGKETHYVLVIPPVEDPTDTMHSELKIRYAISNSNFLMGYDVSGLDFHTPNSNGKHLLSSAFNFISLPKIRSDIASVRSKMAASGLKEVKYATKNILEDSIIATGKIAPDFGGRILQGDSIQLSSIRSKFVLLDFWYAACGPCRYSLPFLRSLQSKFGSAGLTIVGVDPMDEEPAMVRRAREFEQLHGPEFMVSQDVAYKQFGVQSYPTFILLDQNRKVLFTKLGYQKKDEAEFEAKIASFLNASN